MTLVSFCTRCKELTNRKVVASYPAHVAGSSIQATTHARDVAADLEQGRTAHSHYQIRTDTYDVVTGTRNP